MVEIEFIYNGIPTSIQCGPYNKFSEILKKLNGKIGINLDSVFYLYNGNIIENKELTFSELANATDKERNKMCVYINDIENTNQNNIIIKSNHIICPKCGLNARLDTKNYRMKIYDCINEHEINNILLEEYENQQKVNLSKIICDICKSNNKGNSYKNIFYFCNTCGKNLCPICKDRHNQNDSIINYDEKNYVCKKHNYSYALYCITCKRNICVLCEMEHNGHEILSYGKIINNKENIMNKINKMKNKIDLFNNNIKDIINKLNKVMKNVELLYEIYKEIINKSNYKNYENIQNLNDLYIDDYTKELSNVIEENNLSIKIEKIMDIYDKIVQKNYKEKKRNKINMNRQNFNQFNNFQNNNNNNLNNLNNLAFSLNNMNNNNIPKNNFSPSNQIINNFQQDNLNSYYNFNNLNYFPNNMNNNNFNLNNKNLNMMMNFQNINNNNVDIKNNKNDEIFVTFTFKKNGEQIYIDVDKNEKFGNALNILEHKYNWLKKIIHKKYYLGKKEIKINDFNKTLNELGIKDNSDIIIDA